ncbi:MAG: TetR/AcrR family transcriptional regulator [Bacteroidetes bacterium]|nr:MAG: TetR/AcrR family transcriptional regulator [Bacteroidota bacterium]
MPRSQTKLKIIEAALALFAKQGVSQVKLQHIADEVGISVGNLAYHFKHKEELIETVHKQGLQALEEVLKAFLEAPGFYDFDRQLSLFYHFSTRYHFCFSCNREIHLHQPQLAASWQDQLHKFFLQICKRLDLYQKKGWLQTEWWDGCYEQLAHNIFLCCCYWLPQQQFVEGASSSMAFRQAIWSQIRPYLSPQGNSLYAQTNQLAH